MPWLLLLAGCDTSWLDPEPVRLPIPFGVVEEGVAHTSVVTRARLPPPALWGELPDDPYALGDAMAPVLHGLCFDAPGAREAAEARIAEPAWSSAVGPCREPGFCAWVASRGAWDAAAGCADPALLEPMVDPARSDWSALTWFATMARAGTPVSHPRLFEATERALAADLPVASAALEAIAALPDGAERLRALRAVARDPALIDAWIAELGMADDPEALEACAADRADTLAARRCFADLARRDRAAARRLAEELGGDDESATLVASLLRYGSVDQLVDDLVRRGLLPHDLAVGPDALTPVDALLEAGLAVPISRWMHEPQGWTLRLLAARAGLADVPILVQPALGPPDDAHAREPRRTQLAWVDGVRLRALAYDGEHADLAQAVGFVNALLAERGRPERYVFAPYDGEAYVAVLGEPAALRGLVDDRLLSAWVPEPLYPEDVEVLEDTGAVAVEVVD